MERFVPLLSEVLAGLWYKAFGNQIPGFCGLCLKSEEHCQSVNPCFADKTAPHLQAIRKQRRKARLRVSYNHGIEGATYLSCVWQMFDHLFFQPAHYVWGCMSGITEAINLRKTFILSIFTDNNTQRMGIAVRRNGCAPFQMQQLFGTRRLNIIWSTDSDRTWQGSFVTCNRNFPSGRKC